MNQYPRNLDAAKKWEYKFWSSQPMPKVNESVMLDNTIETEVPINETPEPLIDDFVWVTYDLSKEENKTKVSSFLDKYYGLDTLGEFSKQYNNAYLDWQTSGNKQYIALGVEYTKNNSLVGFIYGHVTKTQVNRKQLDLVETNLLCIHPKLREKKLTCKLVKELRRQFNILGYKYGTFSTVNYLSKPIASLNTYNRVLSAKVLVDTGFIKLDKNITLDTIKKESSLPEKISFDSFIKMEEKHVESAYKLFNQYMGRYNFHPIFTKEQFKTEFLDNKFITTYVIENEVKDGNVLDFISYYTLVSRVNKKNEKYKTIKRGYLYYYTCLNSTPYKLLQNLLIMCKKYGVDVFTATENMENQYILKELGFDEAPTIHNYYLYNYKIPTLQNIQVAKLYAQ